MNRQAKATGADARLVVCPLPIERPWRNPIEPSWRHAKGRVIEPARPLSAQGLAEQVCHALDCASHDHRPIPE